MRKRTVKKIKNVCFKNSKEKAMKKNNNKKTNGKEKRRKL